jgi:hypothetical protein
MAEPYVTLDDVAVGLRNALGPLVAEHGIETAAVLIELSVMPVERCLPVLRRLPRPHRFTDQICACIGRGGDDREILGRFGVGVAGAVPEALDAWLRLHERGYRFPDDRAYPGVAEFLRAFESSGLAAGRPDLLKRARAAAVELGLGWPLPEPRRW